MWLTPHLRPEWAERYGPRADEYHLPHSQQKRLAYALQIGQDGLELMDRIDTIRKPLCYGNFLLLIFFGRFGFNSSELLMGSLYGV